MNQILSTDNNRKSNKKNYNLDIKKIIIIFAILIGIFAVTAIGIKVYGIIKEKQKEKLNPINTLNKPIINIEKIENVCVLKVNYDEGLEKITYYWNNEDVIEKNMNGSTTPFMTQIVIPEGDYNVLYVKAIGVDGSINEVEQKFAVRDLQDENKPEITWYYNEETGKITIIAKSDKGIENLTYEWEGEEKQVIEKTEENQKELIAVIDVKRGTNQITITSMDGEGNIQTKQDLIQGIYKPTIQVQLINNKTISININHDMGFKKITINVNGEELIYDENSEQYSADVKNLATSIDVEPGIVTVKISVYTLEEENKEYTYEASTEILE